MVKNNLNIVPNLTSCLRSELFETFQPTYGVAIHYADERFFLQADQELGTRNSGLCICGAECQRFSSAEQNAIDRAFSSTTHSWPNKQAF